jgi:hypothetical protein
LSAASDRSSRAPSEGAIETRTARIWLGEDGIVRVKPRAREPESIEDAHDNVAAVLKVTRGVRRPMLLDLAMTGPLTPECREYYMSPEATGHLTAVAIVTGSLLGRIVGNLTVGSNPTGVLFRLFETEPSAREWLEESLMADSAPRSR